MNLTDTRRNAAGDDGGPVDKRPCEAPNCEGAGVISVWGHRLCAGHWRQWEESSAKAWQYLTDKWLERLAKDADAQVVP